MNRYYIKSIGFRNYIKLKANEFRRLFDNPYKIIDDALRDSRLRVW